jgi:glycosyltransferase involved in cell wall biosynthesis
MKTPILSVIIPSRNEQYLSKTVDDIFAKVRGEIEVIVILDEKDQALAPRPNLIVRKKIGPPGLRSAIRQAIEIATGKYIMKTDAHCMFSEGFDTILCSDCEDNWVVVPRRYSLLPETWAIDRTRPAIDYEYYVFPLLPELGPKKSGGKWLQRAKDRKELLLDEDMAFQASCWFTTKEHLINIGGFDNNTSAGDRWVLESEELANKTWLIGGKCMVNKKAWYAHWYKGTAGRGYRADKRIMRLQREFQIDYWMHDKWPKAVRKISWLIERFMPIPGYPLDWQDPKYKKIYKETKIKEAIARKKFKEGLAFKKRFGLA